YELGGKFALLGGRATLTASVYQNEWSDIPVVFFSPGCVTATTLNGGSAQARGFESEGRLRLNDTLDVNFGLGYVDSELTATTTAGRDGDRMNFAPKFSGNVGLEYAFPIVGRKAFLRGDYSYFGSYYSQPGERGLKADSYSIVNLRAGWAATQKADVVLYVDNLADSDALTSILGPSGFPPGYGVRLRPRTVGVGLSYNFY
ncbi:MAG: TonB-dependent receptor domain-containing protein, partial [Pseudomonas fluorescens]